MGWHIELFKEDGHVAEVDRHKYGSTVPVMGTKKAKLHLTFNYSSFYYDTVDEIDGLEWIDGKKAGETINRLRQAVDELGTEKRDDYWESDSGNAGFHLAILRDWAEEHPDATWEVRA